MLPSPSELQYFLEVASSLNISRAAERLGVTQPTLSLAVQRLERSVGVPLLVRAKSGVRLTKAGTRFAQEARSLVDQWDKVRSEALSEENEVQGRLTLGCHPSVGLYSLPHILPQVLSDFPRLEVILLHDLSRKITERVISFEIDLGIVVNPVSHPDLVLVPLCSDEVTFWRGPKKSNDDVLICDPELIQTQALVAREKKVGIEFRRRIPSANLELIAELVANGAGIGILPGRVATRNPALKLKPICPDAPIFQDKTFLVYRKDMQRGKAALTMIDAIKRSFRERGET